MGFMDELKDEYKKGQEDAEKINKFFGKKAEANASTSETEKKKLPIGQIVGAVVIGAIGAAVFGLLGFLIGAVVGFFGGGFIWDKVKGAAPKLSSDDENILTNN